MNDRVTRDEVFRRYSPAIHRYVTRILGDEHEAEDIVQDAFEAALEHRASYDGERGTLRAWILGIARNQAMDRLRQNGRHSCVEPNTLIALIERESTAPSSGEPVAVDEAWLSDPELSVAVENLQLRHRQILFLRYGVGLSGEDIARYLDLSHDAVRSLQKRALGELRSRLAKQPLGLAG